MAKKKAPSTNCIDNAISIGMEGFDLKRLTNISELLNDKQALITIVEVVSTGGSITTAEMKLGLSPGMLKAWLANGKNAAVDDPYNIFYRFYITAAAEAKNAAESSLLIKNPAKWLELCDPTLQLTEVDKSAPIDAEAVNKKDAGVTYKEFGNG